MHNGKTVSSATLMTNVFSSPIIDGITEYQQGIPWCAALFFKLCRQKWITHPSGACDFNNFFNGVLAEFALH
jgi:hypothetical protein